MNRGIFALVVATLALLAGSARADAASPVSAQVDSVAVVTTNTTTVFDFDLYDCPPGAEIVILEWTAREPDRPDSDAVGAQPYGLSNGDPVQHLTLEAGSSSFLAGERWVGSGTIACGALLVPVEGSGFAKSLNGL